RRVAHALLRQENARTEVRPQGPDGAVSDPAAQSAGPALQRLARSFHTRFRADARVVRHLPRNALLAYVLAGELAAAEPESRSVGRPATASPPRADAAPPDHHHLPQLPRARSSLLGRDPAGRGLVR